MAPAQPAQRERKPGPLVSSFVQARNYTRTSGRPVDYLVVHYMVAPEKPTTAENVAAWFAGPDAPQASAHYNIDTDTIVQSVREKDVAWHAPGVNHNGIGLEHAGREQSVAQWHDATSKAILALSVELAIVKVQEYHLPVIWRYPGDLLKGLRGVTGHVDASRAFHRSDHTDPGPNFPRAEYIAAIREGLRPDHTPEPKLEFVPLLPGARGWRVKHLQRLLDGLPKIKLQPADGVFGDATERAVKQFQRQAGIQPAGRVGEKTWKALLLAQKGKS